MPHIDNVWAPWIVNLEIRVLLQLKSIIIGCLVAASLHVAAFAGAADDAYAKGDYVLAFQEARPLAEQGQAKEQQLLGLMYFYGQGVAQDYAQALVWFRKAAEQGYAAAQNSLGVAYRSGGGVTKDDAQAVMWFRKAAEQGDAAAEDNLGLMYGNGRGVSKDYAKALE